MNKSKVEQEALAHARQLEMDALAHTRQLEIGEVQHRHAMAREAVSNAHQITLTGVTALEVRTSLDAGFNSYRTFMIETYNLLGPEKTLDLIRHQTEMFVATMRDVTHIVAGAVVDVTEIRETFRARPADQADRAPKGHEEEEDEEEEDDDHLADGDSFGSPWPPGMHDHPGYHDPTCPLCLPWTLVGTFRVDGDLLRAVDSSLLGQDILASKIPAHLSDVNDLLEMLPDCKLRIDIQSFEIHPITPVGPWTEDRILVITNHKVDRMASEIVSVEGYLKTLPPQDFRVYLKLGA